VDVTKSDGSDPNGWVTQMEHYFSLYNITDDLAKLWYGVLHLIKNVGNGGNGEKPPIKHIFLRHTLWKSLMNSMKLKPTIWFV
jgi:hypothetical protein